MADEDAKNKAGVTNKVITQVIAAVVVSSVLAILAVIGGWIKQQWIDPFQFTVRVAYLDPDGKLSDLPNADVVPDINNVEGQKTNAYGQARFSNVEPHPFKWAAIEVRHDGCAYRNPPRAPVIPIRKRDEAVNVVLQCVITK